MVRKFFDFKIRRKRNRKANLFYTFLILVLIILLYISKKYYPEIILPSFLLYFYVKYLEKRKKFHLKKRHPEPHRRENPGIDNNSWSDHKDNYGDSFSIYFDIKNDIYEFDNDYFFYNYIQKRVNSYLKYKNMSIVTVSVHFNKCITSSENVTYYKRARRKNSDKYSNNFNKECNYLDKNSDRIDKIFITYNFLNFIVISEMDNYISEIIERYSVNGMLSNVNINRTPNQIYNHINIEKIKIVEICINVVINEVRQYIDKIMETHIIDGSLKINGIPYKSIDYKLTPFFEDFHNFYENGNGYINGNGSVNEINKYIDKFFHYNGYLYPKKDEEDVYTVKVYKHDINRLSFEKYKNFENYIYLDKNQVLYRLLHLWSLDIPEKPNDFGKDPNYLGEKPFDFGKDPNYLSEDPFDFGGNPFYLSEDPFYLSEDPFDLVDFDILINDLHSDKKNDRTFYDLFKKMFNYIKKNNSINNKNLENSDLENSDKKKKNERNNDFAEDERNNNFTKDENGANQNSNDKNIGKFYKRSDNSNKKNNSINIDISSENIDENSSDISRNSIYIDVNSNKNKPISEGHNVNLDKNSNNFDLIRKYINKLVNCYSYIINNLNLIYGKLTSFNFNFIKLKFYKVIKDSINIITKNVKDYNYYNSIEKLIKIVIDKVEIITIFINFTFDEVIKIIDYFNPFIFCDFILDEVKKNIKDFFHK